MEGEGFFFFFFLSFSAANTYILAKTPSREEIDAKMQT